MEFNKTHSITLPYIIIGVEIYRSIESLVELDKKTGGCK